MYIKSIKMQGFKSFADKTELDFDKNICAIVGPNGSGKSNVVDALLWVLGEQSVKTLRGDDKMSDIIFSGSKSREGLTKASVSILFDNEDHTLPSEFGEVEIKRTIYKTGENEYFINNSRVRLKDITDLILDVSSKFNIITQGNINALVDNKSSERRVLFENAAGVLKYKKRKEETLKKLDNTKENITRLNLIIKEVMSSLKPLEKQKREAEKYIKIKDNLENIEVSLIASDITNIKERYENIKLENSKLKKEQEVNVFLHPEELEKLKLILLQMDEEITKSNEQIIQINDDISRLQSQKQINLERVKLSVNESAINENLLRLKEEKLSIEKNIAVLDSEIKSLKDEYNILIKEYNDKNNTQLKEKIKITTLKSDYNVKSKELFDLENKINIAKSNIENNSFLPKSIAAVLNSKALSGICDRIENLIEVNVAHKIAISSSLGAAKNFIVTTDFDSAKRAIKYLKNFDLGRCTFFPLDTIKSRYIDNITLNSIKDLTGFIGIASDLVSYDKKYKNIIENQLGNVIIVDSLDDANKIGKKTDYKYKIVSLEGDILYSGGAVSGGRVNTNNDDKLNLLHMQNEYNDKKGLLQSISVTLDNANDKYEELEKEINEVNSKYNGNESLIKNNEIEIGKLEVKMDSLLENLQNEYNMTYENALKSYELTMDPEEAREIVIKYKNDLKGLTNINTGSISEYDRLSKRYDFLAGQKDDLESSSKELYNIIDEMDDIMKKRFKETFDKISTEFSIVFRKMFKGGNGVLKLTDENDLLNTGISILAVPPGKKLNSTSMLSGGEKALTAICLIFAILNVKPAPFIVLDEVEAPLDEENVSMFGDYLKSMQNISQFILITHKKKMMEYASNLYGVTMQESGVSKLVSVKLENNVE